MHRNCSHSGSAEKQRTHRHYLKSTVFCGACGGRLCLTNAKGKYLYFFCVERSKRSGCQQRYVLADKAVAMVERYYRSVQLPPDDIEFARAALHDELASQRERDIAEAERQRKRLSRLADERKKLLDAHYEGAIPLDLLKDEQAGISREVAEAERLLAASERRCDDLEATIRQDLDLVADCYELYLSAPESVRRLLNQFFFEKVLVDTDDIA